MQSADGDKTLYLQRLHAITGHPDGVRTRVDMLHRELVNELADVRQRADDASKDLNAVSDDRDRAPPDRLHSTSSPRSARSWKPATTRRWPKCRPRSTRCRARTARA
jgi:hypothetical protein